MTFTVKTTATISAEDIAGLLCGAFEGGSNYWYCLEKYSKTESGVLDYLGLTDPDAGLEWIVVDAEDDEDKLPLNRAALDRGLAAMAEKYPWRLQEILEDRTDGETSDVFLQCCLFGEVVFG